MRILYSLILAFLCLFPPAVPAQCSVGAGPELVVNGNFDLGMVGFTSDMVQGAVNSGANRWELGVNANLLHPSFTGIGVPTPFMFVANGPSAAMRAWFQTVPVSAGTNYVFAAKVCNVVAPAINLSDPSLRLAINGIPISATVVLPEVPDVWVPLCAVWNSGASTSALLTIETLSTASSGNDFGIDSISFKLETVFPSISPPTLSAAVDARTETVKLEMGFTELKGSFVLENSDNGSDFQAVATGTVNRPAETVEYPAAAFGSKWRLMQQDEFGNAVYSQVVEVRQDQFSEAVLVFPNPVRTGEAIAVRGFHGPVRLVNGLGQTLVRNPDGNTLQTAGLIPGIYLLTGISRNGKQLAARMVLE